MVVDKKDGGHKFCENFRRFNPISKPLALPLSLIDDILALRGKAKYFFTIDLRSEYWQMALDEADREKAAFVCHLGLFQFRVISLSLANALGIFPQLMSIVLSGIEDFVMAYLSNILVFLEMSEQHCDNLRQVLG